MIQFWLIFFQMGWNHQLEWVFQTGGYSHGGFFLIQEAQIHGSVSLKDHVLRLVANERYRHNTRSWNIQATWNWKLHEILAK